MPNVQDNVRNKNIALDKLKEHCMCAKLIINKNDIIVIYPNGDFPVHGVKMENSTVGIYKGVDVMEKHWLAS